MRVAGVYNMNKIALSTAAKNSSCNRARLKLLIQGIFAVITTASFILIVVMAIRNPGTHGPAHHAVGQPRCVVQHCRVTCQDTPYYDKYMEDIVSAVANAECAQVSLELKSAFFINNTLPTHWPSRIRTNIYQLFINGGNLHHLNPEAFMSQFTASMEYLALKNLHIKTWDMNSLVGLANLKTLSIVYCKHDFHANALRAVDDTIEQLTITRSGHWDPINVTGSRGFESLTVVDFSQNNFSSILSSESFVGLEYCTVLYLNSCGIVSIGTGTFDHLHKIQVLYLHDNLLMTIPSGLFGNIVAITNPRPRISLQDNPWHCDCSVHDLRQLARKDILLVDAKCMAPNEVIGKTFTEFDNFCSQMYFYPDNAIKKHIDESANTLRFRYNDNTVVLNGTCRTKDNLTENRSEHLGIVTTRSFVLITPDKQNVCSLNKSEQVDVSKLATRSIYFREHSDYWLKFAYFLQTDTHNSIYIKGTETPEYGLLWFQSDCPNELYCIDTIPTFLQVYNVDVRARYTFCPISMNTGRIEEDECVGYNIQTKTDDEYVSYLNIFIYSFTVVFFFCFGAIIVYGVVRTYPTLLKGSKRILFVKHKTVDALVLPPKVPLRNDLINGASYDLKDRGIFTLNVNEKLKPLNIHRMRSIRSNKSNTPSYISALQPDEDQLADWRIRHHFNNSLSINSMKSELSSLSWNYGDNSYHSLESDMTYESLK